MKGRYVRMPLSLSLSSLFLSFFPSFPVPFSSACSSRTDPLSLAGYYSHVYNSPPFYVTTLTVVAGLAIGSALLKIILNPVDGLLFDGATLRTLTPPTWPILALTLLFCSTTWLSRERLLSKHRLCPAIPPARNPSWVDLLRRRGDREGACGTRRVAERPGGD